MGRRCASGGRRCRAVRNTAAQLRRVTDCECLDLLRRSMFAPKSLIPGQSNFAGMTSATLVERTLGELVYRCHMSIRLCREFHPDEGWESTIPTTPPVGPGSSIRRSRATATAIWMSASGSGSIEKARQVKMDTVGAQSV